MNQDISDYGERLEAQCHLVGRQYQDGLMQPEDLVRHYIHLKAEVDLASSGLASLKDVVIDALNELPYQKAQFGDIEVEVLITERRNYSYPSVGVFDPESGWAISTIRNGVPIPLTVEDLEPMIKRAKENARRDQQATITGASVTATVRRLKTT